MTDTEALYRYRREQARTTLAEAVRMLDEGFSCRSIVNRAYYAMFYMVLALFLKRNVEFSTSKHTGIMALFDKEFVLTGMVDREHSRSLHATFDRRLEFDYKDYVSASVEDAGEAVEAARKFIEALEAL
jgi:uncharacterized protein (UPF0332 family)